MEPQEIFRSKFSTYKQAIEGFVCSLQIDISKFDDLLQDSVKNGQIQKFEYCTELTWKIIKRFLYLFAGIDTNSPKDAIKNFFRAKYIAQKDYETLIEMLEDRNMLSHIYRQEFFEKILAKLRGYSCLMERIIDRLEVENKKEEE